MATVYLPFGYPQIEGEEFETIIYQGAVARKYVIPADPRTDSQVFERKMLSDFTKMRAKLWPWGRGALRSTFGVKWATSIYQLVKADHGGYWSEAESDWEEMSGTYQDEWRTYALYSLTMNDPGKVFFCMARVVAKLLQEFGLWDWVSFIWADSEANAAAAWWTAPIENAAERETVDNEGAYFIFGDWDIEEDASAYLGSLHVADPNELEQAFTVLCVARKIVYICKTQDGGGVVTIKADGAIVGTVDQQSGDGNDHYQVEFERDIGWRGLHYMQFEHTGYGDANIDAIRFK